MYLSSRFPRTCVKMFWEWSQFPAGSVGVGEGRSRLAAWGFSALLCGRNPWKKQVVFRSGLEGIQEMCCSAFYSPQPLL